MAQNSVFTFSTLALAILFAGCEMSDSAINTFNDKMSPLLGVKIQPNSPKPIPTPSPDVSLSHKQINGEFIREMLKVVLKREVRGEEEFLKYMNVLDNGGHYEGIYNGIVYSGEYREKEVGTATVTALKNYANIMAQIALDQKYDPLKIPKPAAPDVPPSTPDPTAVTIEPPQPSDAERTNLIAHYEKEGLTKSQYALKRKLGEEILKTIDLKKEYREKLATWYGKFTVFLNKKGVDFGFPKRNSTDEYYHYKWALDTEEDRVKWECLNRLHVLMNASAK